MRTLLVGSFGDGNIGDELILCAALEKYPKAVVMTADAEHSQTFCQKSFPTIPPMPVGIRSFFRFLRNPEYRKTITEYSFDRIVFAGGGLFCGSVKAYWIWAITAYLLRLNNPEAAIFWNGQSMDKTHNPIKKWLMRLALKNAQTISTRDVISQNILADMGIESTLGQDTAHAWLEKNKFPKNKNATGILLNAIAPVNATYVRKIQQKCTRTNIEFLAMSPLDIKHCPDSMNVFYPPNVHKLLEKCAQINTLIGERFHALVLGNVFAKKTYLLRKPYAQKAKTFAARKNIDLVVIE